MIEYIFTDNYEAAVKEAFLKLSLGGDSKILNIACERRLVSESLKGVFNQDNISGLEINREIVESDPRIKYCDVNYDRFPFEGESFDVIVSIWGMEHFKTDNVFQESYRVLKKGGSFVFITPNTGNPVFFFNKIFHGLLGKTYYRYLTDSQYKPHMTFYNFNSRGRIEKIAQIYKYNLEKIIYLGPSCFLDYFSFSAILQNIARGLEKIITNRMLCFLKPYIIFILKK